MPGEPWLILPTYNEAENIGPFVRAVDAVLARAVPGGHRILVVDDNSPDGTGEIAVALADQLEAVEVLRRPGKGGLGPAYLAGFEVALAGGAGFILEMDSDFSHDPEDLPRLLKAAEHVDLVVGSRYVPGGGVVHWGLFRRAVSRVGCWYAQRVLGLGVRDLTGGFKCFRRPVLETIDLPSVRSTGYAFQVELTYRAREAGYRVAEVPIVFHERRAGHSKMSARIAIEAIWLVPDLRRRAAHALNPPGVRVDA